jgi:serine/threonine-protein kinase
MPDRDRGERPEDRPTVDRLGTAALDDEHASAHEKYYESRAGVVILGRYRLERLIARGGIGVVYLATQLGLDRKVALKLLTPRFRHSDPKFAKRFNLEASTSARLIHPNIVTVHDFGESEQGDLFIAMEYLDGESLEDLIRPHEPMPFERILRIAAQICRALREAHAQGVIHRDLKHSNVMIVKGPDEENPDHVKVLDFGIVKLFQPADPGEGSNEPPKKPSHELGDARQVGAAGDADFRKKMTTLTQDGSFLGSPLYMSPEQICCEPVDLRTDVYSFGVILYELVAGCPPFVGERLSEIVQKTLTEDVPPISTVGHRRACPEPLEAIIRKCLETRLANSMAPASSPAKQESFQSMAGSPVPVPRERMIASTISLL